METKADSEYSAVEYAKCDARTGNSEGEWGADEGPHGKQAVWRNIRGGAGAGALYWGEMAALPDTLPQEAL